MLKIQGLNELQQKLRNISQRARELDGTQTLPVTDLLTSDFIRSHSRFNSANEMFDASGFKIESKEDFEAIPDEAWDTFIKSNTSFSSWKEMLERAGAEWAARKIGL
ncbi:hypothetical protein M2305_000204 [Gluconobacter cerinus]|jgi:hypothetical protein|uniref:hypothetical protein n=1 Tax=Gluconobacter cerinus TaxID=38307 RepID=UPI0022264C6D|nr:hypothetical protein [Gluconobacter cerinus]MCW2264257.1 hypothetical protein [Gluconobacter cerinus]